MATIVIQHLGAVAFLYIAAYLPARVILHKPQTYPTISESFVYLFLGWSALAIIGACILAFNAPFWMILFFPTAVLLLRIRSLHPRLLVISTPNWRDTPAFLVAGIVVAMPLAGSVLMADGDFPAMFLGVDTPYYLFHTHALSTFNLFPPPNLGLFSELTDASSYHYGTSMMAATLTRVSGLAPHKTMFLYLAPTLFASTAAAAVLLIRAIPAQHAAIPLWVGLIIVFFFVPIHQDLILGLVTDPSWAVARFANIEMFGHGYPMFSTQYGLVATLLVFSCLLRFDIQSNKLIVVFIMSTLFFFKSSQYVALGLGVAGWATLTLFLERDWRLMGYSLCALVCGVLLQTFLYSPSDSLIFAPFYQFQFINRYVIAGLAPLLMITLFLVLHVPSPPKSTRYTLTYLSCFIFGPLIFSNLFRLLRIKVPGGQPEEVGDLLQVLATVPLTASVFALVLLFSILKQLTDRSRLIIVGAFLLFSLPAFTHSIYVFSRLLLNPPSGHEYVDNREVAKALKHIIPIEGSLIVTNSLAYPLVPNPTTLKQLQLPSLFGHRTYATIFTPLENSRLDALDRFLAQKLVWSSSWDKRITEISVQEGWTHLLIDKKYPFPTDIPAPPLYDTDEYAVYPLTHLTRE